MAKRIFNKIIFFWPAIVSAFFLISLMIGFWAKVFAYDDRIIQLEKNKDLLNEKLTNINMTITRVSQKQDDICSMLFRRPCHE